MFVMYLCTSVSVEGMINAIGLQWFSPPYIISSLKTIPLKVTQEKLNRILKRLVVCVLVAKQ